MAKAILKATRESRVRSGHPWVFASDVVEVKGDYTPGDVVDVFSSKDVYLGRAFYNPNSQITLRMLTYHDEPVDEGFFRRRAGNRPGIRGAARQGAGFSPLSARRGGCIRWSIRCRIVPGNAPSRPRPAKRGCFLASRFCKHEALLPRKA